MIRKESFSNNMTSHAMNGLWCLVEINLYSHVTSPKLEICIEQMLKPAKQNVL